MYQLSASLSWSGWVWCDTSRSLKLMKSPSLSYVTIIYCVFSAHFKFHYDNHMQITLVPVRLGIEFSHERKGAPLLLLPIHLKIIYRLGTCSLAGKRESIKIHTVFKMKTNTHCHQFTLSVLITRTSSLGNFNYKFCILESHKTLLVLPVMKNIKLFQMSKI